MRLILVAGVLLSAPALAQDQERPIPAGHFYFGPGLQFPYGGGPSLGFVLALQARIDFGDWMLGADARAGVLRNPTLLASFSGRLDRFLGSDKNSFYLGGSFGALDEFDGENYGGDGPFVAAQIGYLWGRDRRWGRAAVELQLSVPLFGERPNKPGDYVYTFASLNILLFL